MVVVGMWPAAAFLVLSSSEACCWSKAPYASLCVGGGWVEGRDRRGRLGQSGVRDGSIRAWWAHPGPPLHSERRPHTRAAGGWGGLWGADWRPLPSLWVVAQAGTRPTGRLAPATVRPVPAARLDAQKAPPPPN